MIALPALAVIDPPRIVVDHAVKDVYEDARRVEIVGRVAIAIAIGQPAGNVRRVRRRRWR